MDKSQAEQGGEDLQYLTYYQQSDEERNVTTKS